MDIAASHRNRLGCSELAAALGVSPWKTPFQLWLEKTGRAEPPNIGGHLRVKLGVGLEDFVARLYAEQFGFRIARSTREWLHPQLPLVGHIDRRVVGEKRGLEVKTALGRWTSSDWGEEGTDQVPTHYLIQCMGYLLLTGWGQWDLTVLMAGPELRTYVIQSDSLMLQMIEAGIRQFWRHVETDQPPDPTTVTDAALRWPTANSSQVESDEETEQAIARLRAIRECQEAMDREEATLKTRIMAAMGEHEMLVDGYGRSLATWKNQTTRRLDTIRIKTECPEIADRFTTETTNRVFRIKEK